MKNRKYEELSDDSLIKSFSEGSSDAFGVLVDRYDSSLHTYIRMAVGDAFVADDILQDTFIKVLDNVSSGAYQAQGKFKSWLFRVAHNLIMDHFRRKKVRNIISLTDNQDDLSFLENLPSDEPTIEERLCLRNEQEMVREWVKLLPKEQRQVVAMRYIDDKSFKEIAMETGVSINTALGRMRYALINLRKYQQASSSLA